LAAVNADGFGQFQVRAQKYFAIGSCLNISIASMAAQLLGYRNDGQRQGENTQWDGCHLLGRGHLPALARTHGSPSAAPMRVMATMVASEAPRHIAHEDGHGHDAKT
jgi:hypothetical protein